MHSQRSLILTSLLALGAIVSSVSTPSQSSPSVTYRGSGRIEETSYRGSGHIDDIAYRGSGRVDAG